MSEQNEKTGSETFQVKVKVKEHPNAWKYVGFSGREHSNALFKALSALTPEQTKVWQHKTKLLNREAVKEFIASVKVGDQIGLNTMVLSVVSKTKTAVVVLTVACSTQGTTSSWVNPTIKITSKMVDKGLAIGWCEVLMRDGKPFGVDEYKTIDVTIADSRNTVSSDESEPKSIHGDHDSSRHTEQD